jgi:predicted transcriptional regulator
MIAEPMGACNFFALPYDYFYDLFDILKFTIQEFRQYLEQIAVELSTSARTIRNDVDLLVTKGWVESSGSTKGRNYKLTEAGQEWVSRRV